MVPARLARPLLWLALALSFAAAPAQAREGDPTYEPYVGQEGKDVVWVPTPQVVVDKMLELAKVGPKDFVMDLGSGDGRTVITAARRGARALGIEYNPDMVALSQRNAQRNGVAGKAEFRKADLFETDFSQATVITMFLLPQINLQLRPKILALRPGTRVVSNTFTMDDWTPDETADLSDSCGAHYCTVHLWIVPARVAGAHKLPSGGELELEQSFQMLTGTLSEGGRKLPVKGRVRGTQVTFSAGGRQYHATARGKELQIH